jgi:hypothetical protein
MMNEIAERWARYVAKRPMGAGWCLIPIISGLVFIALHFLLGFSRMDLFYVGIISISTGFHLFERAGFLTVLEASKDQHSSSRPQRKATARG